MKFNQLTRPFSVLTSQLQNEQLTIPDFNKYWTAAMLKPAVNSNWPAAKKLKALVIERKEKIYSNPIIQAGIYLDPRFRTLSLDLNQRENAKQVISSIFIRTTDQKLENSPEKPKDDNSLEDELEALLNSHHNTQATAAASQPLKNFYDQLRAYEDYSFGNLALGKLDVSKFWQEHAENQVSSLHVLAKIAVDLISVPVTEVTAERLFSHLNFIFGKHRASLKTDVVEDILFCRWNDGKL